MDRKVTLTLILVLIAAAAISGGSCHIYAPVTDRFSSPDGRYAIELRGDKDHEIIPITSANVYAEIFADDKSIGKTLVSTGDWFDSSFNENYSKFQWHSDSVFGFHGSYYEPENTGSSGSLTIHNSSGKKFNFVNFSFGESRLIVIGMEPGATQTVDIVNPPGYAWIQTAPASDGNDEKYRYGVNFRVRTGRNLEQPLYHYCAKLRESGVIITSSDSVGAGESTIAKVAQCGT